MGKGGETLDKAEPRFSRARHYTDLDQFLNQRVSDRRGKGMSIGREDLPKLCTILVIATTT